MSSAPQLPEFPRFRNLDINDKSVLVSLFQEVQPQISELTFTNLFVWQSSEPAYLSQFDQRIILQRRRLRDGRTFLFPPLERDSLSLLIKILRTTRSVNPQPPIYGVTSEQAEQLRSEAVKVESDRDDWDYVYTVSDLASLPGDKYHPKRNFIARCLSKYDCEYASIGSSEIDDCLQLQTRWCNLRHCGAVQGLEAENTAIRTLFENYERFNVAGGVVYIDGKIEAFTVAERLSRDTAVIHFEKANPEVEGLYQLINQWFCQKALGTFTFVNREQDLGIPGLRKAKESYYPHHMVEKYIAYI